MSEEKQSQSEEVRAKLDELGIEWKSETNCDTYWYGQDRTFYKFTEYSDGATSFSTCQWNLTPKQVLTAPIAATVGNSTDLSKRLREVNGLHAFAELFGFDWTGESDWDWHDVACAMADAMDAETVGASTCHMEVRDNLAETDGMGEVWLECDRCHWQMPLEPTTPRFKYCPNCRAEIKED